MGEDFFEITPYGPKNKIKMGDKVILSAKIIEAFVGGAQLNYLSPGAGYLRYASQGLEYHQAISDVTVK